MPLAIPKHLAKTIPRGVGNSEIRGSMPFRDAAQKVTEAVVRISEEMGWHVARTAIDAPAGPPEKGSRASENELGRCGLSSFRTPAAHDWGRIRQTCVDHLGAGKSAATLPFANKIWMLYGFELFASLRDRVDTEIIEVYPFAIVRALLPTGPHKSTEKGYREQLCAIAERTGWEPESLEAKLKITVPGRRDDRLDASWRHGLRAYLPARGEPLEIQTALTTRSGCHLSLEQQYGMGISNADVELEIFLLRNIYSVKLGVYR